MALVFDNDGLRGSGTGVRVSFVAFDAYCFYHHAPLSHARLSPSIVFLFDCVGVDIDSFLKTQTNRWT